MNGFGRTTVAAAALAVAAAGCGGSGDSGSAGKSPSPSSAGKTNQVVVKNLAFTPAALTVTAGTAVTWTDQDPFSHTVTAGNPDDAPSGVFDGPLENTGSSFTFAFTTAGVYEYYCKIHTQMRGTVTVT